MKRPKYTSISSNGNENGAGASVQAADPEPAIGDDKDHGDEQMTASQEAEPSNPKGASVQAADPESAIGDDKDHGDEQMTAAQEAEPSDLKGASVQAADPEPVIVDDKGHDNEQITAAQEAESSNLKKTDEQDIKMDIDQEGDEADKSGLEITEGDAGANSTS